MSPLPTMSVRCLPEHQPLVRAVVRALRDTPDLAGALATLLAQPAAAPLAVSSPDLADMLARLEAVERWIAGRNTDATRDVTQVAVTEAAEEAPPSGGATDSNTAATRAATHPGTDFAAAVTAARKAKGWSTRRLAAEAVVSQTTVSHLESGRVAGSPETCAKIAAALGLDDAGVA